MNFRTAIVAIFVPLVMLGTVRIKAASSAEELQRPNVLFILSDDVGWADFGFNGGTGGLTPNIDHFAAEGVRLTQFYATPVCATTRAALLTRRYPFRQWMDWRSEDPASRIIVRPF